MAAAGQAVVGVQTGWPFAIDLTADTLADCVHTQQCEADAVSCSAPGCRGTEAFTLNGQPACSQACLETLLRSAVLEEQTRATSAALKMHSRSRIGRIGRILIDQGAITVAQLDRALRSQRAAGAGRLGCWLKQQGNLPEAAFTAALATQWRCPVYRLGTFAPTALSGLMPRWLAEEYGAVPLRLSGSPHRLALAFEDHLDYELIEVMERMLGIGVDPGLLPATEFWQATRELLAVGFPPAVRLKAPSFACMIEAMSLALVRAGARESRIVAIQGNCWLRFWVPSPQGSLVCRDVLCGIHPCSQRLDAAGVEDEVEALRRRIVEIAG